MQESRMSSLGIKQETRMSSLGIKQESRKSSPASGSATSAGINSFGKRRRESSITEGDDLVKKVRPRQIVTMSQSITDIVKNFAFTNRANRLIHLRVTRCRTLRQHLLQKMRRRRPDRRQYLDLQDLLVLHPRGRRRQSIHSFAKSLQSGDEYSVFEMRV